jgi:hypothetical protein
MNGSEVIEVPLLDSVILIDHFNGITQATSFIADHGPACAL